MGLLVVFVNTLSVLLVVSGIHDSWIPYADDRYTEYMFATECRTLYEATDFCLSIGGELASVQTSTQSDFVTNTVFTNNGVFSGPCREWRGLPPGLWTSGTIPNENSSHVVWADNTTTTFFDIAWDVDEGEPDFLKEGQLFVGFSSRSRLFHTLSADNVMPCICQRLVNTFSPSQSPTTPSSTPTAAPSVPTFPPTAKPSPIPSKNPTTDPTTEPSHSPTKASANPSKAPSLTTMQPSKKPTTGPSHSPSKAPSTSVRQLEQQVVEGDAEPAISSTLVANRSEASSTNDDIILVAVLVACGVCCAALMWVACRRRLLRQKVTRETSTTATRADNAMNAMLKVCSDELADEDPSPVATELCQTPQDVRQTNVTAVRIQEGECDDMEVESEANAAVRSSGVLRAAVAVTLGEDNMDDVNCGTVLDDEFIVVGDDEQDTQQYPTNGFESGQGEGGADIRS